MALNEYRSIQLAAQRQAFWISYILISMVRVRRLLTLDLSISKIPRTLRVAPWDKTIIGQMEKAINEADLGLSVSSDDQGLRVHFPALTTETRQKLVKLLKDRLEDARIRVRSLREDINKDIDAQSKEGAVWRR
jgi:ribosome recycling factor